MEIKKIEKKVIKTIVENHLIEDGDKIVLRSIWRTRFYLYVKYIR